MRNNPITVEELQNLPALKHIAKEQLERLAVMMVRRDYNANKLIFLEGDPTKGIWFIAKGRVEIIKQSANGRMQGLCLVERGKCFGGCPLFDGDTNLANAQTVGDVTLFIILRDKLWEFIREDPLLAQTFLEIFSQRLVHMAKLAEGLGAWKVSSRINDCLNIYSEETESYPVVSLTHEKLATLAGTAREVVTRHISDLEKAGVVRVERGQIILLDAEALTTPYVDCRAQQI
jgi:CRP/FNR family transcriptional regulator, cyclic AMP receptor protein